METTVSATITINAAPAAVFEYLINLKYYYLWNPQIRSITPIKRLKLGMRYKTESQVLGSTIQADNTVTGFEFNEKLVLENSIGAIHFKAMYQLTPKDDKTTVKLNINLSVDKKIYYFSGPVLKQLALRELRTILDALKIAVENKLK